MEELNFSEKAKSLKIGIYEHYKDTNKRYRVLGICRHSETLEEMVIYKALYGNEDTWIRPLYMFFDEVEVDGVYVPRFKYIG